MEILRHLVSVSMLITLAMIFIPLMKNINKFNKNETFEPEEMIKSYRNIMIGCGVTTLLYLITGEVFLAILWAFNGSLNYISYKKHKDELQKKIADFQRKLHLEQLRGESNE